MQAKLSYLLAQGHSTGQQHHAQQQRDAKAGGAPVVPADEAAWQGTHHALGAALAEPEQTQSAGQVEAQTAASAVPVGVAVPSSGLVAGPSQRQADDAGEQLLGPAGRQAAAVSKRCSHMLWSKQPVRCSWLCKQLPSPSRLACPTSTIPKRPSYFASLQACHPSPMQSFNSGC